MRPLPRPAQTACDTYLLCVNGIGNADHRALLTAHAQHVADLAAQFSSAARQAQLHTLDKDDFRPAQQTALEILSTLYDRQMARQGRPGRGVYDALRAATPTCPLCGVGRVTTLDHHLPKSEFQYLSVTPDNLIPACGDCNKLKGNTVPTRAQHQTLHPYFDDITTDIWLTASLHRQAPASVTFAITPPNGSDAVLADRIRHHFAQFDLARLYSINAANELTGLADELAIVHQASGANGVQAHLSQQARSRERIGLNSWQAATYRALAADPWYCQEGFRL
ncbi:HNH endonuclease [Actinomadura kijaniata]|uniref:HNH endonuclease n=1 Tax=Actinomadura kijaniata TaxID=46161 RepID=UPI003F1A941B